MERAMYTFENGSRAGERPTQLLHQLELTVMWLWSTEPSCDIAERSALLTRLGAASETIERLAFRHEVHPDEPTDADTLHSCAAELDDLVRHWPQFAPRAAACAAKLAA